MCACVRSGHGAVRLCEGRVEEEGPGVSDGRQTRGSPEPGPVGPVGPARRRGTWAAGVRRWGMCLTSGGKGFSGGVGGG